MSMATKILKFVAQATTGGSRRGQRALEYLAPGGVGGRHIRGPSSPSIGHFAKTTVSPSEAVDQMNKVTKAVAARKKKTGLGAIVSNFGGRR